MSLPYPYITDNQYHLNTGSYLDPKETAMLVSGFRNDLWYGFGETDVIEMSVFDLDENPIGWKTINSEKKYKKVNMTYLDTLDRPVDYSYLQLISDFILHKNTKILVNPIEQLDHEFSIQSGSYVLSYNFMREMAGSPRDPLVIKDISPSRREIKIIPAGSNSVRYQAFCQKRFQIKDVAPLLLTATNQCPYDQIYTRLKGQYASEILFLKQLLFLNSDGAFISFLKTLYEDVVVYTTPNTLNQAAEKVKRTQGIRTYYQNLLLSNYESVSDFFSIDGAYDAYVTIRVEQKFKPYGTNQGTELVKAKKFLTEFFTTEFYHPITLSTRAAFDSKFYSYLKNALNFGNNVLFQIIDHAYLDERVVDADPLTLLVKLKSELPEDFKIQSPCWISNISIAPLVINAIVRKSRDIQTVKISPPNFSTKFSAASLYNTNDSFSAADLRNSSGDQQTIDVNKKISELQVDYTDFSNFIIFSSARQRLSNFKTKIATWTMLSSSYVTLNANASQSLSEGRLYPQYISERGSIESQMSEIISSFDGYESYLFKSGSYVYNPTLKQFINSSYVSEQDQSASLFDKSNRDSFINNTPDHIVLDDGNDDYLTFLNMTGHYFDNIYLYIANLPAEKVSSNDPTLTFSKKMVDYMLESFGWDLGTTYEDMTMESVYTTSSSATSAEDRTKSIRTRILNTLPQIYKTKGTEEAVQLLLSCYGIPSNLLDVREYGNDTYTTASLVTYTKQERSCMFHFSGSGGAQTEIRQLFYPKPTIRTLETKMLFQTPEVYTPRKRYPFVSAQHSYTVKWDYQWAAHTDPNSASLVPSASARQYYSWIDLPAWRMGFMREYGNMGRIWVEVPTIAPKNNVSPSSSIAFNGSGMTLTSDLLPIFDGEIFGIRLRRNESNPYYQDTSNPEWVPTLFDLTVQRNASGRQIFRSFVSAHSTYEDNMVWDGRSTLDAWEVTGSLGSQTTCSIVFGGHDSSSLDPINLAFGNAMVWDVAVSDVDFEVHCNDYSSFSYSGSEGAAHLITRMDYDEPINFITNSFSSSTGSLNSGYAYGHIQNKSEYYQTFYERFGKFVVDNNWTGSPTLLYKLPVVPMDIHYSASFYWFPLHVTQSNICSPDNHVNTSIYPYEFLVKDVEKTYTTPNYGPNRFQNEKVNIQKQGIASRLDDKNRSTFNLASGIQSDSNLLGLYLDPQDAKNRDIVKYCGNRNLTGLIGDPSDMYSSSYSNLRALNLEYNSFGDRRVLYNELISLYKIYFSRDTFEAIENIIPARSSVRTGVVVEPTVLERPKYQYRPIAPEMNTGSVAYFDVTASHYAKPGILNLNVAGDDTITKILRFSGSQGNVSEGKLQMVYGEFNVAGVSSQSLDYSTLPANPLVYLDVSYLTEANFNYPVNWNNGYYPDIPDSLQLGNYGGLGSELPYGMTTQEDLDTYTNASGSNSIFLVKQWDKYTIYFKSGSYTRTSVRNDDAQTSHSIWLYKLVGMTPSGYQQFFYTADEIIPPATEDSLTTKEFVSYVGADPYYLHKGMTAKGTPNQTITGLRGTTDTVTYPYAIVTAPYFSISENTYFEVFGGYPRNHYTHKRMQFSPMKFLSLRGRFKTQTSAVYVRGSQTIDTTIDDKSGLGDASLPVQSIETSNVNLQKSNNVINQ
jgi:hypothetical protein